MKIEIKIHEKKADIEVHQCDGSTKRYSIREDGTFCWKVTDKNRGMTVTRIQGDVSVVVATTTALKEILAQ